MVKQAGMTPIAFNDGIEFANKMSASVGSTTYTFDRDIVVCYWSGGWSGYTPRTAANLASDGFRIINTTGDFYYVLGKNDSFDNGYTYAANWSNYKVCGTSLSASSVIGGMFCMWSDYPGAETQTQEARKIRLPLRAMGLAMDGAYTSSMDTSVVPGGFNADGSINTDPPAQSHDYRQTASTAATCTEAGSVTYTCADCGDSYTETVPALGHNYAAADDAGDTIYTCTRCGEQHSELLPREYVSVKTGKTTEAYTLEGEQTFTHTGDDAIARGELTVVQGTGTKVSYSASASASVSGYTDGGYNCVASKLIDGDTSTYYWSTSSQTSGMYARVDLGAEVRFDAVQISAPAHGDYCTNANVQLSADGRTWTTIGTFTSSRSTAVTKTYAVPSSVESFRYIQVALTTARNYWWQLSEIAWGSYDGATFTRAAASGTVQTGTAPMTEVRFTGVAAGTTYYVIGGTRYVIEVEADHVHSYQEVSRTAPTCTEDGVTTYRCETCGDTYTETTPATGHSYTAAVTAPTCTEKGYTTYTCTACGDHYTANEVAALGHDYAETTVPATCTENGSVTHTCTRCGNSYTETLPATGHTYTVSGSEATCTEGGKTVHTCTVCGDTYTETTPALGHDYKAVVTSPTCTEKGYTTYTCATCGDHYTADEVAALGHDYEAVVTAPTCTNNGYTTHTCSVCGDSYVDSIVPATGHSYDAVVTAPTCTNAGYTTHTCSVCGDSYVDSIVPATGHSYEAVVTAPTCDKMGYTTYTCSVCGDSYVGSYTDALEHTYTAVVTKEPTCTEEGVKTFTCSECGKSYTEAIPTVAHSYEAVVTAPTCDKMGYTTYTCSVCGDSYVADYVDAVGHDCETETVPATCLGYGFVRESCKHCDYSVITEITAPLGHDYQAVVTEPTLDEAGYTTHTCSRCGDSYVDSETPALGHKCAAYTDIPTDWAKEGICFVIENGLMVGTTSTTFAPKDTLTRAMLVTVLYRMAGSPAVDAPSGFADVDDGQWYSDAIAWAAANGIVNGVGGNKFAPSEPVTREQLAAIFFRYAKAEAPEADVLSGYPDAESVSTYARDAMAWAVSTGLVTGSKEADGTYLAPQGLAAREQAAAILMRYVKANA